MTYWSPCLNETSIDYNPPSTTPGPSLLGNPNLAPEKVTTVDLGLSYQGRRFQAGFDYFHSKQTDNIILDARTINWKYVNLGEVTFQGIELEGKFYLRRSFFLMGSVLYQTNKDENGNKNVTPIANVGAKAGVSYESANGLTASLFDIYQGPLDDYLNALNPRPGAYHLLNANLRYDLSRFFDTNAKTGLALVIHADNLTDKKVWLPDWKDNLGDSIFSNRGRTVYFGIEVSLKKD